MKSPLVSALLLGALFNVATASPVQPRSPPQAREVTPAGSKPIPDQATWLKAWSSIVGTAPGSGYTVQGSPTGLSKRFIKGLIWILTGASPIITTGSSSVQLNKDGYFLDPNFVISSVPQTRRYTFTVTQQNGSPDGFQRPMLVVNNQFPGPLIEANQGDTIIVNVINKTPSSDITIHWHGMIMNGTNSMDGPLGFTQCPISAGVSFTYQFKLDYSGQFGTYWWHSHAGDTHADGIMGPLVVHSPNDAQQRGRDFDREMVLFHTDWYHDMSEKIVSSLLTTSYQGSIAAPTPNSATIQGIGQWNCTFANTKGGEKCTQQTPPEVTIDRGLRYRIRVINGGSHAEFIHSVDGHKLSMVMADDTNIQPVSVNSFLFANGQRYDYILNANVGNPGDAYTMRSVMNGNDFFNAIPDVALETDIILRYRPSLAQSAAALVGLWKPPAPKSGLNLNAVFSGFSFTPPTNGFLDSTKLVPAIVFNPPGTAQKTIVFDSTFVVPFGAGGPILDDGAHSRFTQNGISFTNRPWEPLLNRVITGTNFDQDIANVVFPAVGGGDIVFVNDFFVTHPIHLHTRAQWVVATGPVPYDPTKVTLNLNNPMRRDTHIVPPQTWIQLRLLTDVPGVWSTHCHIGWHFAQGLAMTFIVQPDVLIKQGLPASAAQLCATKPANLDPGTIEDE